LTRRPTLVAAGRLGAKGRSVSEKTLSQFLRDEYRKSEPTLPQLIRDFVVYVDLYLDAAHQLSCVHEAQKIYPLAGRDFRETYQPAKAYWLEAKRDVWFVGDRLAKAMTDADRKPKKVLQLLNVIERDGARSHWPGDVDRAKWDKMKAWLQQIALQTEQANESDADRDPTGGKLIPATPRTRGRKRCDPQKGQEVADAWERARNKGVQKKDFIKDWNEKARKEGRLDRQLSIRELNCLLSRIRMRRYRANKQHKQRSVNP
jgi:hypothetical protein